MKQTYDAILVVSFGGPEKMEDVIPFLENVLRGRNVPRERLIEVSHHYERFGGVSPINGQVRELIAALRKELDTHGIRLPLYWGNRNWHPMLADTLREMATAGVKRALAFVTAAYSSYSSCRQYREDIERARMAVGVAAPQVDKLRSFFNHPGFVDANADRVQQALEAMPLDRRQDAQIVFTAHSIPVSMAAQCGYEQQLRETCSLVAGKLGLDSSNWRLVFQSRSGRPQDPWLAPDISEHLRTLHASSVHDVVVMPIGFVSDHMEVMYDLDVEARDLCGELGINMLRAGTAGTHPSFVRIIRELIEERLGADSHRACVGTLPANPDICPVDCCPAPIVVRRSAS